VKQVTHAVAAELEGKDMTRLGNFALGVVVAGLLVGPTAWADAHQKAPAALSVLLPAPAPSLHISNVLTAVRSVLFSTP
jgi:hypothetical protein